MTVRDLIRELDGLKEELKDIEVRVRQPNGLLTEPSIKFLRKNPYDPWSLTKENTRFVVIE